MFKPVDKLTIDDERGSYTFLTTRKMQKAKMVGKLDVPYEPQSGDLHVISFPDETMSDDSTLLLIKRDDAMANNRPARDFWTALTVEYNGDTHITREPIKRFAVNCHRQVYREGIMILDRFEGPDS